MDPSEAKRRSESARGHMTDTSEHERVRQSEDDVSGWRRWGPYVSDRAWATVREDYSADGEAWAYLTHELSRSKAYRWGEDGIAGFCDRYQLIVFAPAFWNGRDPILKEGLFGLSGPEGNHGEDVKEYYFYLDATSSHSYLRFLYKYPQAEFPYQKLKDENARRGATEPEYELLDTGIFDEDRYFDVEVEYAKATPEDVLMQITAHNRGPDEAPLHILPTLWFRHTWSWAGGKDRPTLRAVTDSNGRGAVHAQHRELGSRWLYAESAARVLVTGNETNNERVFGSANDTPYVKDGIDRAVVHGESAAVDPS